LSGVQDWSHEDGLLTVRGGGIKLPELALEEVGEGRFVHTQSEVVSGCRLEATILLELEAAAPTRLQGHSRIVLRAQGGLCEAEKLPRSCEITATIRANRRP
jgi:hypothetical protein